MTHLSRGIGLLGIVLLIGLPALAQSPAEEPLQNIQVFPAGTTRTQLLSTMNAMNESLGVQCVYCHVAGAPGQRPDFVSDANPKKDIARRMMLFRDKINEDMPAVLGAASSSTRVLCSTCHRGVPIPRQIYEIVFDATAEGGDPAVGLAKFEELRSQFYGGQSYDFSELALVELGRRATAQGRTDDAMAYLLGNFKYHPNSVPTYLAIARAKDAKGDRAGAIQDLEKAAALNPGDERIGAELARLKGA
ncbi:MAG: c-type cytochrome [Acidobacteria bacterium]|nr:c-type cytochrome [Acidobacteriota bacterium]